MKNLFRDVLGRVLGDRGERAAIRYLRRKRYRIITRGFRVARGEIDIIARDGDTLVFIEVKTRRRGQPAEAVTPEKQRRITRAALVFLSRHGLHEQKARFDVVAIVWPDDGREPEIEHFVHAFETPDLTQLPT